MELSTPKTEGKLHHARSAWCISFPSVFGVDTSISPKNITTIPYHFISTLLNANFDFDVSVANDVAIDVAKCALPGKVMQWSPCPEVRTLTNENGRYKFKLNDYCFSPFLDKYFILLAIMAVISGDVLASNVPVSKSSAESHEYLSYKNMVAAFWGMHV